MTITDLLTVLISGCLSVFFVLLFLERKQRQLDQRERALDERLAETVCTPTQGATAINYTRDTMSYTIRLPLHREGDSMVLMVHGECGRPDGTWIIERGAN